jgi:hypothetical protein
LNCRFTTRLVLLRTVSANAESHADQSHCLALPKPTHRPTGPLPRLVTELLILVASLVLLIGCSPVAPSTPAPSAAASNQDADSTKESPSPLASQGAGVEVPSESSFDACALIPPTDLSTVLGGEAPVGRVTPAAGWVVGQCAWSGSSSAFLVSVGTSDSIAKIGDPGVTDAKAKLAEFERRMAGADAARPVSGIGDGAIVAKPGMAAYKGDLYIEVANLRLTEDQLVDVVKLAIAGL